MIDTDRLYVRRPGEPPLVLDVQPLNEALEFATLSADNHVVLYVSQLDWHTHRPIIDALRSGLRVSRCSCCRTGRCHCSPIRQ